MRRRLQIEPDSMKFPLHCFLLILAIFPAAGAGCARWRPGWFADREALELRAGPTHRALFYALSAEFYPENALPGLFANLETHANAYCAARFAGRDAAPEAAQLFRPPADAELRRAPPESLAGLRAGCWNFYEMNDVAPERDFELVRALSPEAQFDCYSVGLLQPYIMHATLNCRELTMLDIDWRIHALHHRLLGFARAGALASVADAARSIASLELAHPALSPDAARRPRASLDRFCRPLQRERCAGILPAFQRAFASLRHVRLELAALHEGEYPERPGLTRVVYLSNAIEESYTSAAEFDQLIDRLRRSAERTYLIYHVGGWKLFGLYELTPTQLRTVCKDDYLSLSRGSDGKPASYTTYFETRGAEPARESCAAMSLRLRAGM